MKPAQIETGAATPDLLPVNANSWKGLLRTFLLWFMIVFCLRFPTYFMLDINVDESVYLVMGQKMLHGELPYVNVFDTTSPGIFLIFAAGLAIFRDPTIAIRTLACIAVAAECVALVRLVGMSLGERRRIVPEAVAAGLYAIGTLGWGGTAGNREIFFIPFVSWAVVATFRLGQQQAATPLDTFLRYLGPGLLLGCAFFIKQLVLFEILGLALLAFFQQVERAQSLRLQSFSCGLAAGSAVLAGSQAVMLLAIAFYAHCGQLHAFLSANFRSHLTYVSAGFPVVLLLKSFWLQLRSNPVPCIIALVAFICLFVPDRRRPIRVGSPMILAFFWLVCALCGICSTGKFFNHYFLQALPVVCWIAALLHQRLFERETSGRLSPVANAALWLALSFVSVGLPFWNAGMQQIFQTLHDRPIAFGAIDKVLADYLRSRMRPTDSLFIVEGHLPVYYLTSANMASRYIFQPVLTHSWFAEVVGIDNRKEMEAVFDRKPDYVLFDRVLLELLEPKPSHAYWEVRDPVVFELIRQRLDRDYLLETTIDEVEIYRLRSPQ